ncbi:ABC transporter permease [Parasphaerochaeta coccoides]|uniref:Transport permease protein n=1 Tax=Parasphaerochaeta coccoides (strain ATCC BAA-1237 / DSM 17374 / SPN1) TaxID=760011 RepID=F4GKS3_PARC1|nr:ABC transporter permease [Parasphaerochaeta coccoides]AEC01482.1 ABC-2 type transporter [Parasphaerochaeta coccoides DSM 17374]
MRALVFAKRITKELLRDPINLFFGLGFPLVLLFLFAIINDAMPPEANNLMYAPEQITPGVAMFGTIFMALFSGMLLAKDRTSSFLMRLFTSPMRSSEFIIGYTLPMLVFAAVQVVITFVAASFVGLPLSLNLLLVILVLMPITLMFVGIGLLCGSLMNDKAVGGLCGALLTNVAGWLSGVWIPLDMIGGVFKATADVLPFYHAAESARAAIQGDYASILPHLAIVLIYTLVIYTLAVIVFRQKMSGDKA